MSGYGCLRDELSGMPSQVVAFLARSEYGAGGTVANCFLRFATGNNPGTLAEHAHGEVCRAGIPQRWC